MTVGAKKDPYEVIIEKMEKYPNNIPRDAAGNVSEAFIEFIKLLYTPEEAKIAQYLEVRPMPARKVAKLAGITKEEATKRLDAMVNQGILHDIGGYSHFVAIAHLFNNGWKLVNHPIKERLGIRGAELFQKFFIEEGFYKRYESGDDGTALTRIVPVGATIQHEEITKSQEEMHALIDECILPIMATDCPCRSRTEMLGIRECKDKYPIEESCFQVGEFGKFFKRRGEGRELTREEAHELVDKYSKMGLVFTTENTVSPMHQVICTCCGCCCSILRGMTRFDPKNPNNTTKSNYIAKVNQELCKGCGLCARRCVYEAITVEEEKASVDPEKCYGCGVCGVTCPTEAVKLYRMERSLHYPNPIALTDQIYKETHKET